MLGQRQQTARHLLLLGQHWPAGHATVRAMVAPSERYLQEFKIQEGPRPFPHSVEKAYRPDKS